MSCPVCGAGSGGEDTTRTAGRPAKYCSQACRQRAYLRRRQAAADVGGLRDLVLERATRLGERLACLPDAIGPVSECDADRLAAVAAELHALTGGLLVEVDRLAEVVSSRDWFARTSGEQKTSLRQW